MLLVDFGILAICLCLAIVVRHFQRRVEKLEEFVYSQRVITDVNKIEYDFEDAGHESLSRCTTER